MNGAYLQFGLIGVSASEAVRINSVDTAAKLAVDLIRTFSPSTVQRKSDWRMGKDREKSDWKSATHFVSVWKA